MWVSILPFVACNDYSTNMHVWILFFQMPQKVPLGRGNRQQRDVRAKGVRGNKRRLKQNNPVVDDVRKQSIPASEMLLAAARFISFS